MPTPCETDRGISLGATGDDGVIVFALGHDVGPRTMHVKADEARRLAADILMLFPWQPGMDTFLETGTKSLTPEQTGNIVDPTPS